jgi:hypothetical protein
MHIEIAAVPKPANGLGVLAALCGVAGAVVTGVLWLYQQRPASPLMGQYGYEIAYGGPLREDLTILAALLGSVAIVAALLSSIGGRTRASAIAAVLLGAVALTFPLAAWFELIGAPLARTVFPAT